MSFTPENSPVLITPEIEKALQSASSMEEVKSIMRDAALNQDLVKADHYDPYVLTEKKLARTVNVAGEKHRIEALTEAELARAEADLWRQASSANGPAPPAAAVAAQQSRDRAGRFLPAQSAAKTPRQIEQESADRAQLDMQLKLGQIDAATYLDRSGAIANYLEKRGVDLESIKMQQANDRAGREFEQSWAEATETFLHSSGGADWPGGDANRDRLGAIINANPEFFNNPSVETLTKVFEFMKANNLLVLTPEQEKQRSEAYKTANSFSEIQRLRSPESGITSSSALLEGYGRGTGRQYN
jgi:hypothetical protein